jgi:hypothetical protein
MKSRQLWITLAVGLLGFLLGIVVASVGKKVTEPSRSARQGISHRHASSGTLLNDVEENTASYQIRKRERKTDSKESNEPRVSIPISVVTEDIRKRLHLEGNSSIENLVSHEMERILFSLGVAPEQKEAVHALIRQTQSEINAEEQKQLKAVQTSPSEIRLDKSAMAPFSKAITQRTQTGIRENLPPDLAEALIGAINWQDFYPTDEKTNMTFSVIRDFYGKLAIRVQKYNWDDKRSDIPQFPDDGTPVPADEIMIYDRWKPFLKGLTLLPQDQK